VTDSMNWDESLCEIEDLVRAAGSYVEASRDLRPRVLEAARTECAERRAQRSIRQLAIVVVMLTVFTIPGGHGLGTQADRLPTMLAAVDSAHIFSQAENKVSQGRERGWAMVEAFTDLRRQQADVLRLEL
jgi:hypothetical protein